MSESSPSREATPGGAGRIRRGFLWMVAQTLGTKSASIISQIVLAWLLLPSDFGLVGMALTVTTITAVLQHAGLGEILVQQHRELERLASTVFGLAIGLGLAAGALMLLAAPVAAWVYASPDVATLICILAASAPLQAVAIVPRAKLQAAMEFRALSLTTLLSNWGMVAGTIVLALLGFGPWSLVLPRPFVAVVEAALLWRLAPPATTNTRFDCATARRISRQSAWFFGVSLAMAVAGQIDYLILGIVRDAESVGYYFFAFNLSTQVLVLLTLNLTSVLLPAFAQLANSPDRQADAFVRACRLLAAVAMPLCIMQTVVAEPLLQIVFGDRWTPAIPLVQALSAGWAFRVATGPSVSLLKARNQMGLLFSLFVVYAASIGVSVVIGARFPGLTPIAVAVAATIAVTGPLQTWVALRQVGRGLESIRAIYAAPSLAAGLALVVGWGSSTALGGGPVARLAVGGAAVCAAYVLALRVLDPGTFDELTAHAARLAGRGAALTRKGPPLLTRKGPP